MTSLLSLPRALLVLSIGVLGLGCDNGKSTCGDEEECPSLTADALASDAVLTWDPDSSFSAKLGGETTSARVNGGQAVVTLLDTDCRSDCEYTLKSLYFELERLLFATDGSISIDELRLGIDPESSVALPDSAGNYELPAGTPTLGCARVNDGPLSTKSVLEKAVTLAIDPVNETFTFQGELPFEFGAMPNRECADYELTLSGNVAAAVPWEQNPARPGTGSTGSAGGAGGEPGGD